MSKVFKSHKQVTATPMNRLDYCEYRGWELPADEDGTDTGYLLKSEDGSVTWVLSQQFEADFTEVADTPLGRLRVEANDLGERLSKLKVFLKKGRPAKMPLYSWELLHKQARVMETYLAVLGSRIEAFV